MKRSTLGICCFLGIMMMASCSRKATPNKDIDFLFDTIEHVWNVTIEYTRQGKADQGLDICEKYVRERQNMIEAAGKRMSEDMFKDEVRRYYAERTQKNRAMTDKYEDYLTNNLSAEQMKRFNDITAGMVGEKYMTNIQWTTDPWEFFWKAIKAKF